MSCLHWQKNLKLQLGPGLVVSYDIQPGTECFYSGTQHMFTDMSVLTLALYARLSRLLVSF